MPQHRERTVSRPVHWAFAVPLRVSSQGARRQRAVWVEHVVSGQAVHFASREELLAFMVWVLATARAPPPLARG